MNKPVKKNPMWLAVRFTHLPLESLGIHRNNDNMIISYKGRVCAATDNLHSNGIALGMPTSTAQLLHNTNNDIPFRIYERELDSEKKILEHTCRKLYDYTPHIEEYRVNTIEGCEDLGLLLEISCCIKLFKGVEPLIEYITAVLDNLGLSCRYGQGHTKKIAWLLSYTTQNIKPDNTREGFIAQLNTLSIDHLYEYPKAVEQLKKSGFFCFGDITRHIEQKSMQSFRNRFGEDFGSHLAEMLDIDANLAQCSLFRQVPATYTPKKNFVESIHFDYPVSSCEQLLHPITTLLICLTKELIKSQAQTQSIFWNLYDIYQNQESFIVNFERLHCDSQLAIDLTMIQLENQPLPFEVDVLELRCEKIFPASFNNASIHINDNITEQHAFITVCTKLNAKLGENAVFKIAQNDAHIPELTFTKTAIDSNIQKCAPTILQTPETNRPGWIFNIPVKIGKRQSDLFWKGKIELLQGPERIESLWWKKPTGRDYFVAMRDDHVRLWVFYDLYKGEWFVHGVFA